MSYWTHIVAAIDVDTCIESKTIKSDIEELIKGAPKITGSERDADVFVNIPSGTNLFNSTGDYQTIVVITVIGDLRDRRRAQTKEEWLDFKNFIKKQINNNGFFIRNCACHIKDW